MMIVKDIDGVHRVLDEVAFYEAFTKSAATYFGMTGHRILDLKRIADTFCLKDQEDIDNFIHDHSNCQFTGKYCPTCKSKLHPMDEDYMTEYGECSYCVTRGKK
jgi:hypothetical protein